MIELDIQYPIYVTGDTHFDHYNIIRYCDRPFEDTNLMNETMIDRWNEVISDDDTVIHVGDFALTSFEREKLICEKLNGYKILILGNHDKTVSRALRAGFDEAYKGQVTFDDYVFSHYRHDSTKAFNVGVDYHDFYPIPLKDIPKGHIHGHTH